MIQKSDSKKVFFMERFAKSIHLRQEELILGIMRKNAQKQEWSEEKKFNATMNIRDITDQQLKIIEEQDE